MSAFGTLVSRAMVATGVFVAVGLSAAQAVDPGWYPRTPSGTIPSARDSHAMAYDGNRHVTVLFGGHDGEIGDPLNRQTWEWNGTAWSLRGSTGPSAREAYAMAFDSGSGRNVTVLFGGDDGAVDGETWEWNGTTWTQKTFTPSPSPRKYHAMAYDGSSARHETVLFGGYDSGGLDGETWVWNGTTWTKKNPLNAPSARHSHAMAYDNCRGVTVLFGGYDGALDGETWEWDGSQWWLRATTGPGPRRAHVMAFDSCRCRTVLFGGYDSQGLDNETWEWDGNNWTQIITTPSPGPRRNHAMAFDSARCFSVLLGGYDGEAGDPLNDETWEYGTPPPPCALIGSLPAHESSLWRSAKNCFRLSFNCDITAPPFGGVLIQQLLDNGEFGPDLSADLTFTVENDGQGQPRVLRIQETGTSSVLTHRTWSAVRNTGGWSTVQPFEVQYVVMICDCNEDKKVLATDLSCIFPCIPTSNAPCEMRCDINGDGKVLATDLSVCFPRIPSATPPKPSGH